MSATETPSVRREAGAPAPATATTRLGIEGMRCAPVKGAYTPDVIVADHGKPLRLTCRREEAAACSERPQYEFTCDTGMLHDKIVLR